MKIRKMMLSAAAAVLLALSLAACGGKTETTADTKAAESSAETSAEVQAESQAEAAAGDMLRVSSLKGPTTMGLVNLMKESESGASEGAYSFSMATQPDELLAKIVGGETDIALVPANMAAVLYNKTQGAVSVIDINTLGVLYCITGDENIHSVKDFSENMVITTGQGATPEYVLNTLLKENGVLDCTVEFKSEATEIAATLNADPMRIAVLPQPFATVAVSQNEALHTAFSLTDEWDSLPGDSRMVTGVTVVRNEYLKEHPEEIELFLKEHEKSAAKAAEDVQGTAALVAEYGIIEKAPLAEKALPLCNIVCIRGEEMKTALSGYLDALYQQNPKAVGGALPEDSFYYMK